MGDNHSEDEKSSTPLDNNRAEGSSHDSSDRRERKKSKKKSHKRKRSRRPAEERDTDTSQGSEDDDSRRDRRKHKKKKKRKKHKKQEKDDSSSSKQSQPSFGKYGILKREDFPRMQRALEVWLDEVKSIAASVLSRRDLQNYFDEFREDFNTATMPHKKFYNFDAWEQAEWNKQQASKHSNSKSDEQAHKALKRQEDASVKLDSQTIADMKHQSTLRTQMQVAFRTGDTETYERLRRRLHEDT
jgi:hypothetical protein